MKALVYMGPEVLSFEDMPDPQPERGEVLIKVAGVGICGSDMHAFLGHDERRPAPLILGHEVAGTIAQGPEAGRRVTVNPLVSCGTCRACLEGRDNLCPDRQIISMPPRQGGFAEYISMPLENLVTVPDGFSLLAASLAEPIACGWHAVRLARKALHTAPEQARALVLGGGAIGVGSALCLQAQGISNVTLVEPNDLRRTYLAEMLPVTVLHPDGLAETEPFELVSDGVGFTQTRASASQVGRPGGVIMHIGLGSSEGGLDIRRATLQELSFIGTYTYTAADFRATAAAMFAGQLGPLDWFETCALSAGEQAFHDIRKGAIKAPKIVLKP